MIDRAPGEAIRTKPKLAPESVLLAVAMFLFVCATNILTPLLPVIRDDFGVSISTAGVIVGSYGLARLAVDLPAGFLADRVGHRRLSAIAVVVLIVSSLVGLASPTVEVLIAVRVGSGIAVGILAMVVLAALSATASYANRGKVMSLFHVANNAGIALYPLIGGVIGAVTDWRLTFLVTAVCAIVAAALLLPLLGRIDFTAGEDQATAAEPSRVLYGRQRAIAITSTCLGVVANMIHRYGFRNTILPLYAATVLGLGGLSIATAIALMSITGLIVATPGGMLGDRIGRRRVITVGLVAVAVGDLAFLLTGDLLSFLVIAALIGAGDFFAGSQTSLLAEIVPPGQRTRVLAGYRFSGDIGAFLGPVVLAVVMDWTDAGVAIALAAIILLMASLVMRIGVPGARLPTAHPTVAVEYP